MYVYIREFFGKRKSFQMITAYDSTIVGFGRQEFLVKYALDKNNATCFVAVDKTDKTKVTTYFIIWRQTKHCRL
jgi:hypothetical protein